MAFPFDELRQDVRDGLLRVGEFDDAVGRAVFPASSRGHEGQSVDGYLRDDAVPRQRAFEAFVGELAAPEVAGDVLDRGGPRCLL